MASRRWVVISGLLLALLVGLLGHAIFGGYPPPCHDDLAFDGPQVDVSVTYNGTTETVLVQHRKGETLDAGWTEALTVVVQAGDSGNTSTYSVVNAADEFPIAAGDRFRVRNFTVSGRPLAEGDTVRVVWHGSERPLPSYCPNSRSETTNRLTVAEHGI